MTLDGGSKNHATTTRLLTIINHMFFREKVKSKTKNNRATLTTKVIL